MQNRVRSPLFDSKEYTVVHRIFCSVAARSFFYPRPLGQAIVLSLSERLKKTVILFAYYSL